MLNTVLLFGFVSRQPRRFGDVFFFPLAVYRDPDRNDSQGDSMATVQRDVSDFPPVVVLVKGGSLPSFVRHKALVRVQGWVRTRNRSEPLYKQVCKSLIRAGMEPRKAQAITDLIPKDLESRTVEVEIVAERIWPEGGMDTPQKLEAGEEKGQEEGEEICLAQLT